MDDGGDDKPYHLWMKNPSEEAEKSMRESIMNEYRRTLSHPSMRKVLANVPNIMMFDDHEVRDDWGWRREDFTPGTPDYKFGWEARRAYYYYQRQLREDIDFKNYSGITEEYHHHILNGIGIIFFDYRGVRTWHRGLDNIENSQIGKRQMKFIDDCFDEFSSQEVNTVIIVSSMPIAFLGKYVTKGLWIFSFAPGASALDDVQEHWAYKFSEERLALLKKFAKWKNSLPTREIIFVGGDVHIGGFSEICFKRKPIFKQLTASAINNKLLSRPVFFLEEGLLKSHKGLGDQFEVNHIMWTKNNNYGIVSISLADLKLLKRPNVKCKLILSDDTTESITEEKFEK